MKRQALILLLLQFVCAAAGAGAARIARQLEASIVHIKVHNDQGYRT